MIVRRGGVFYQEGVKNQKIDLIVIRVNKTGEICNARPCHNCLNMMKAVGIRKVYYSTSSSEIVCENVKDMISIQTSAIAKHIEKLNGNILVDQPNKYYENLLKKYFPPIVKKYNLEHFIKHNLINVLPDYEVKIESKKKIVWILDSKKNLVLKSQILF